MWEVWEVWEVWGVWEVWEVWGVREMWGVRERRVIIELKTLNLPTLSPKKGRKSLLLFGRGLLPDFGAK